LGPILDPSALPVCLEVLNLSDCSLAAWPNFSAATPRLLALSLSGNLSLGKDLSGVAHVALALPRLTRLDLSRCGLSQLPAAVLALPAIRELNVEDNDLAELPPALGALPGISFLSARGNPLRNLRRDLVTGGGKALIDALRSRILPGTENNHFDALIDVFDEAVRAAARALNAVSGPPAEIALTLAPEAAWQAQRAPPPNPRDGGACGPKPAIDPVSLLELNEIQCRINEVEARLEIVSLSVQRAALARRDLAALRAAAARAKAAAAT
jgi:Leucine-rich repeat (LRR) protein